MKIIHCADLHLDSAMERHLSREQAALRREELLATFFRLVEYAKDHQVALILIAGDMFDGSAGVHRRIRQRVLDQIRYAPEIEFLYLRGNHDKDLLWDESEELPRNLKYFGCQWTSYTYGHVTVTGSEISGPASPDHFRRLHTDPHDCNIVMLHGQAQTGSGGDCSIPLSLLAGKGIDYLALGHIHTYQTFRLDERGICCYSGCLEGRGFDECGPKGFVLLEVSRERLTHRFIPFARRTLHEISISVNGSFSEEELLERAEERLAPLPAQDMVRLVFTGEIEAELSLDLPYLTRRLEHGFYFIKLVDQTTPLIRYQDYERELSLRGEFVRLLLQEPLSPAEREEIISLGLRALAGKEIDI